MRTIAIVNQKGGCGKTTTAINLAAIFAGRGKRTLLVDLDPQSHCAAGLGVPESQIEFGIGEALITPDERSFPMHDLLWEVSRNLDLAPSTTRLAALEAPGGGLHELPDRDRRLAALLGRWTERYDLVLIDCPPTIGLLTFNALRAAREAIIPVETGYFSLRGAEKQWKTIQRIIDRLNRPIVCHMVPTLYDPSSRIARELLHQLQREFPHQLADAPVREHESLREAASFGQPIVEYAPGSPAHRDFEDLAEWLDDHEVGQGQVRIDINRPKLVAGRPAHRPFDAPAPDRVAGGDLENPGDDRPAATEHASGSDTAAPPPPLISSRAAELVQRVRDRQLGEHEAGTQTQTQKQEEAGAIVGDITAESVRFGVNQTSGGVVFCQPHAMGRELYVAGEFNGWSSTRDRFLFDERTKTWQTTVQMPPGRYLYRLVVDGLWQTDMYNEHTAHAGDGTRYSVLTVDSWQDNP